MIKKGNLNRNNIKKIHSIIKYIDNSVYDCNDEVILFKEELESNILIEINELIENGQTEDMAVDQVVKKFKKSKKFKKEIHDTFNKVCYENILKISSIGVIIGFILFLVSIIWTECRRYFFISDWYMEMSRTIFKVSLVITAISLILFGVWEIANMLHLKRSRNFIFKIIPINLIGILDFIIIYFGINNSITQLFLILSLPSIPFFYYLIIRNKQILI